MLYASQRCADALMRASSSLVIERPLSGMGLRERLRWYDERLAVRSRMLAYVPHPASDAAGMTPRRELG